VRAVRELAERAGVDPTPLERSHPRDRRADLLRDFFGFCRFELVGEGGAEARAYLERRGFPDEAIADSGLGVVPAPGKTHAVLERAGYRQDEIAKAGVLADSRWPGRLCGAWRDGYGRIGTLWARSIDGAAPADSRYLYLRGANRTNLPPYGLSDLLDRPSDSRREIVLVEGFFDLHQLRARGIDNVAALGGTSIRPETFERLHRLGIEGVTVCLDNDEAGRTATARAIENSARARQSPEIYVVDPERFAPAKDPDDLVRKSGVAAWREVLEARTCGIRWQAHELAAVARDAPASARRAALARAGRWLGTLPPRLALEQEDAVRGVAELCGYTPEAVERAFRARYWSRPLERVHFSRPPERTHGLAIGRER
jgi:DNA primase